MAVLTLGRCTTDSRRAAAFRGKRGAGGSAQFVLLLDIIFTVLWRFAVKKRGAGGSVRFGQLQYNLRFTTTS